MRLSHQLRIEVQIKIQPAICFGFINFPRHEPIRCVVIALGLDKAGVKPSQLRVRAPQLIARSENLKFLTGTALDQRTTNQMIDRLKTSSRTDGAHQGPDPRTWIWLPEMNPTLLQEIEHQIEMLKLFDGDGVQFAHIAKKLAIFFQRQRRGGSLAFQVRVVDQHCRQIRQYSWQPICRNFFAQHQHRARRVAQHSDTGKWLSCIPIRMLLQSNHVSAYRHE